MEVIKVPKVEHVRLAKLSHQFGSPSPSSSATQDSNDPPGLTGSLLITPHHLIWSHSLNSGPDETPSNQLNAESSKSCGTSPGSPGKAEDVWIAHSLLTAVEHLPRHREPTLLIRLATFVFYTLSFSSPNELDDVWDSLKALTSNRKPGEKEQLFAFVQGATSKSNPSSTDPSSTLPGWDSYDPHAEFTRMKVIGESSKKSENNPWRLTTINKNFNFCSTYPSVLLTPSKISDTTLTYAVKYRSKGRLPIGTYVHWANGSSITRSSQPMVGFKNARSIQDEKLIEAIFHSHSLHTGPVAVGDQPSQQVVYGATSSNLIIDARPTTNAMANTVKGAGTENMEYYKGCRKAYLGIDNIHVMRDSLGKVVSAIHESFVTGTPVSLDSLKRSGWLKHIGAILEGTSLITRTVHVYNSHVLIHCSDGWDRTSQLSALSQVCLDPYYRTFQGFAVLVEKDWLSFGHKFSDRSGIVISGRERVSFGDSPNHSNYSSNIARDDPDESISGSGAWVTSIQKQLNFGHSVGYSHAYKETSPVFHQFLDCVYQLQCQYPKRFEFNSCYLERLHEELHAGNYGTFLFDCEKERIEAKASSLTRSVWELFLPPNDISKYKNPQYDPSLDDPSNRLNTDQGVLYPEVKDVIFWWEIFGCPNEEMNPPKVPDPSPNLDFTHVEPVSSQTDEITECSETLENLTFETVASPPPGPLRASNGPQDPSTPKTLPSNLKTRSFVSSSSINDAATSTTSSQLSSSYSETQFSTSPNPAADQFQNAFQQAKIMGWSTWDRLKKGYEEVARGSGPATSPRVYHHQSPSRSPAPSTSTNNRRSLSPQHQQYPLNPDLNPWSAPDPRPSSSPLNSSPTPARPASHEHSHGALSLPINDPWQTSSEDEPRSILSTLEPRAHSPRHLPPISHDDIDTLLSSTNPAKDPNTQKAPLSFKSGSSLSQQETSCRAQQADIDPLGVGFT
ncbi:hypothetical protein PGT21_025965 [Puccinia graminis f. sp. tritici]|uniref:Myotubularin phosphatase domain-containing protein n=2 Tax=Puccinia graminis f. sp. tritici TaxID=56615 RepID=E3KNU9_PUCGT|nr:uncharacterized protein PGTG_11730 [Puccinia graminis f. sp. tritici CRL 75-36-700-3]EFP85974.1 hypothetical protein PGTG_11730 [Puccinia graminis f. sp. tritici CRL 75-36-700-3]KAA1073801.1 hypothetical protein PGT21_025965 [Puccinia graminis f. sp. tritici]